MEGSSRRAVFLAGQPPGLPRPGFLPRKGNSHRGRKTAASRDEESHKGHRQRQSSEVVKRQRGEGGGGRAPRELPRRPDAPRQHRPACGPGSPPGLKTPTSGGRAGDCPPVSPQTLRLRKAP